MIYEYSCSLCERIIEIEHPMNEVGNLSEENKKKLSCPGLGKCEFITEEDESITNKIEFNRVYSSVNFLKFDKLPSHEKQKILKKRASDDFKKNIEEKKRAMQSGAIKQIKDSVEKR